VEVLTYRWVPAPAIRLRSVLREISAHPAPPVVGLRSRHWRIDQGAVQASYLFQDKSSLEVFAGDPGLDPALQWIADHTRDLQPSAARHEQVVSLDVLDHPVFIISAPRSGSTLLYELLSQSSQVFTIGAESEGVIEGIPSLHLANRGFDSHRLTELDVNEETTRALTAGFIAQLRDHSGRRYLEMADDERPRSVCMIEKTPENSLRVSFLAAAFPTARFIFLHRDARQSVSSILEAWQHEGFINIPNLPGWRRGRWHLLLPEGWRELNDASLLEVAAFQWSAANHRALEDLEALPLDRWISVDYMELVAAPEETARRICEFAGIAFDKHLAATLTRPLPVSSTTISPPSPLKWRSNPAFRESALDRFTLVMARLRDLGRQSAPPPRPINTPVRFSCFLDEIEPQSQPKGADWMVNPSFHFQLGPTVPLALLPCTRFRERFLADFPLLWVEDAATDVIYPFWLRREQAFRFRQFAAGQPPPALNEKLSIQLADATILTTRADIDRRRREGMALVERAAPLFLEKRYCALPSLIRKSHAAALARYYQALIDYGEWLPGDEQVCLRHGYHNETVSRYFHHQLAGFVSRVAGEPVKPTYAYVSAYKQGAVLRPHVDRKQCVFTLSLWIDYSTQSSSTEPWPLWFQTNEGKVAVTQRSGDAVLFRGCELPHWRDRPPAGSASTTLLFHYVPRDFIGVLD
jgi:hypothetical protein